MTRPYIWPKNFVEAIARGWHISEFHTISEEGWIYMVNPKDLERIYIEAPEWLRKTLRAHLLTGEARLQEKLRKHLGILR